MPFFLSLYLSFWLYSFLFDLIPFILTIYRSFFHDCSPSYLTMYLSLLAKYFSFWLLTLLFHYQRSIINIILFLKYIPFSSSICTFLFYFYIFLFYNKSCFIPFFLFDCKNSFLTFFLSFYLFIFNPIFFSNFSNFLFFSLFPVTSPLPPPPSSHNIPLHSFWHFSTTVSFSFVTLSMVLPLYPSLKSTPPPFNNIIYGTPSLPLSKVYPPLPS